MSLTKVSFSMTQGQVLNVLDYGADPTGTNASDSAFSDAIAALSTTGGTIRVPAGTYRTTAAITLTKGVQLIGDGYWKSMGTYTGVTTIYGDHTDVAIVSLKGAVGCKVQDISLYSTNANVPKTGLLLGRSSAASAGLHEITRVSVYGYFSKAAIYSIASESNTWLDVFYWLEGGGALYGFYTSQGDDLSVDSLTGSSNLDNTVIRLAGINAVNNAAASGLYMLTGAGTGNWNFIGAYITQYAGSYITVDASADASNTIGPLTFLSCSGEIYTTGSPKYGFNITAADFKTIKGLTTIGSRFQLINNTATEKVFIQNSHVTLANPNIVLQPSDDPGVGFVFQYDKISGGVVSGGTPTATAATLVNLWEGTWAVGNGWSQPSYIKKIDGFVQLVGAVNNGLIGTVMFTLPAGFRPVKTVRFPIVSNGVFGVVEVATNGDVTCIVGNNSYVLLDGISFPTF